MLIEILAGVGVILLLASLITNVLLWKAGERQMVRADSYEQMYEDIVLKTKERVLQTYLQMKQLDNVNGHEGVFSKDDEVGSAFKQILEILQEFNELTPQEDQSKGE